MRSSNSTRITIELSFVQSFRAPKVCDFDITIEVAQHIISFDVSMNYARFMNVIEAKNDFLKSILAEIFTALYIVLIEYNFWEISSIHIFKYNEQFVFP